MNRIQLFYDASHVRGRTRTTEIEPLHRRASSLTHEFKLFCSFDTFCRRLGPKVCAEARDGANDGSALVAIAECADEGTINLDRIERKFPQVRKRGVPDAEIV